VQCSFPISWLVYSYPKNWEYINFIHFLAPFVVLGIGLDDIFVFTAYFDSTLPYTTHFALDTRLTSAFTRSSGATLATSTTSAFAFAANVFSPVPAVQSFGLLLATLVVVNYLLVILWTPICLAVWDRYIHQPALRRTAANKSGWCFSCCLETSVSQSATAHVAATSQAITSGKALKPQEPRVLEYGKLAWPTAAPSPDHRLSVPEQFREMIRVPPSPKTSFWSGFQARFFGGAFDAIWKARVLTILLVVLISIAGAIGTAQLTSPQDSEPPLFEKDHNVQFFYRYQNSRDADNIPTCPSCKSGLLDTLSNPSDVLDNPDAFFSNGSPLLGTATVRPLQPHALAQHACYARWPRQPRKARLHVCKCASTALHRVARHGVRLSSHQERSSRQAGSVRR
jgi:hypothetical protein